MIIQKNKEKLLKMIMISLFLACGFFSNALAEKNKIPKNHRIAIIGAGASGLTAAYYLKKAGYKNVVVLEKNLRPGGKVQSIKINDRIYEMGAVWAPRSYKVVRKFIKKYNLELENSPEFTYEVDGYGSMKLGDYAKKNYKTKELIKSYRKIRKWVRNYDLHKPGFYTEKKELNLPMSQFLDKERKAFPLADTMRPFITGCGYGHYEDVPALYVLKFMNVLVPGFSKAIGSLMRGPKGIIVKGGYQRIWEKVAEELNVRYGHEVVGLRRFKNGNNLKIEIITQNSKRTERQIFDSVIISTNPKNTLKYLEATPLEKELFSKVRTYPYYVTLFTAKGLKKNLGAHFIKRNESAYKSGHPLILSRPYPEVNIYQAWSLGKWGQDKSLIVERLSEDIEKLGGELGQVILQKRWNYFPHVSTRDLNEGFYKKLNGLQGKNNTYYIGGVLGFETVELSAEFAKKLIKKIKD